jgi:monoamine oxidase
MSPLTGNKAQVRIVIIGAGLAGLSAANQLLNNYTFTNVRILEAGDRVGGRVRWESTPGMQCIHAQIYALNHTCMCRRAVAYGCTVFTQ